MASSLFVGRLTSLSREHRLSESVAISVDRERDSLLELAGARSSVLHHCMNEVVLWASCEGESGVLSGVLCGRMVGAGCVLPDGEARRLWHTTQFPQ